MSSRWWIAGTIILAVLLALSPLFVRISTRDEIVEVADVDTMVAIVFGAGLNRSGEPSDVLEDRLSVAADLYHQTRVDVILVSGDNRFENYNEPEAMAESLTSTFGVPEEAIEIDYAGRRTYDTCVRANTLWGVDNAVLITQAFHLPRAIWTCEQLGIESVGVSASLRSYIQDEYFELREWLATYKALLDIYVLAPDYIGGDPVVALDP